MKLAIQEKMLPGDSIEAKFQQAKALGLDGVEVISDDLDSDERMETIAEASIKTGVPVAAVYCFKMGIVSGDERLREGALERLRDAICCAADFGAAGVIYATQKLRRERWEIPDLSPWMTAQQLAMELFYTHLRTLEDYSMALGVKFFVQPVNRYETNVINRVEQAAKLARRLNHPHVRVAPNLFHMMLEEKNLSDALTTYKDEIGYLSIADSNRRLPGQGLIDFAAVAGTLKTIDYDGWVTLACGETNQEDYLPQKLDEIAASLAYLRERGWS